MKHSHHIGTVNLAQASQEEVVLVVDDDSIDREVVEAILEQPDRRFIKVESGQQALQALRDQPVSVVLLDVQMPVMDGFETARRIRAQSELADLPILFLTATYSADEFVAQGFGLGAQDYLTKPLNAEMLRNKVSIFVRLHRQQQALLRELEQRRRAEQALRLNNVVFEYSPEGVIITDARGVILTVNSAFEKTTGYCADELVGHTPQMLQSGLQDHDYYRTMWRALNDTGHWQNEIWNRRKDGAVFPEWVNVVAVRDDNGAIVNYVGIYSDLSGREHFRERLHELAFYEPLTGLPNRDLLLDHLKSTLAQAHREARRIAVIHLVLDRFQQTNEALGQPAGDDILRTMAKRLRDQLPVESYLASLGGDDFAVVLPTVEQTEDAARLARYLLDLSRQPFSASETDVYLSASIGVSLYPDDGEYNEILLAHANTAANRSRSAGGNAFHLYTPSMNAECIERLALEADLRLAIEQSGLSLAYQPQIDLKTGRLVGVEALARWQHPVHGPISPGRFIPVAEEAGLIGALGEWALASACEQANLWLKQNQHAPRVGVNISSFQLQSGGLAEMVTRHLDRSGLPPRYLELELTESMLIDSGERTQSTLKELRDLGLQLAIDDFGTGYSSLSYLKRFAIQKLKIDRSFINDVPGDPNDVGIVEAIIAMAHRLNLRVVAEGVETQEQLDFLKAAHCDEVQGYFTGRPMPAEAMTELLMAEDDADREAGYRHHGSHEDSGSTEGPRP